MAAMNNHRESKPAMTQTTHPLDLLVDDIHEAGRELVRIFSRDGLIDDEEHAVLKRHGVIYDDAAGYRGREVFAESFKRNGASKLTTDRLKAIGYGLIDLEAERKSRPGANVISFPTRQNAG